MFNRQEIEKAKLNMAHTCGIPSGTIQMYPDGRFNIYGLDESTANRLIYSLSRITEQLYLHKGRYDFSHYYGIGLPKQKCDISGLYVG